MSDVIDDRTKQSWERFPQKVHKHELLKSLLRDLMKHMTTAGNEDWDEVVDVLDHISDASSDEDPPAMNTSGGR